jgi:TfoX/Sxy family transcriptional regulator of competence genes
MKSFELEYLLEPLEANLSFSTKAMFGGLAVYYEGKMVLLLAEDKSSRTYRGQEYPYLIWNGLLIPTDRAYHSALLAEFSSLKQHPVLGKWLFLSLEDNHFENIAAGLIEKIKAQDERIGIFPKEKKKSSKSSGPRKIRSIRNLGPKAEADLNAVGINSVKQFFSAGWEEIFCRLVLAYPQRNNLNMLYALIAAHKDMDWRELDERDKFEAQKWVRFFK